MTSSSTPEKQQQQHVVDQAGGDKDVTFSSDGMEPVPIEFPVQSDGAAAVADQELDISALMTPEQAFDVFAGKLYVANPYNNNIKTMTTHDDDDARDAEGPLQRLEQQPSFMTSSRTCVNKWISCPQCSCTNGKVWRIRCRNVWKEEETVSILLNRY